MELPPAPVTPPPKVIKKKVEVFQINLVESAKEPEPVNSSAFLTEALLKIAERKKEKAQKT